MAVTPTLTPTERTRLRRVPDRGRYDVATVHAILDEALVCHVGFVVDGRPAVIPTIHARDGDRLYVHGSPASRMLRAINGAIETCVTVTLVDGLVLARSALHHSLNYRSVVVYGAAHEVSDPGEKRAALRVIVEHVAPGRWDCVRPPTEKEVRGTLVLALPLAEASAKLRTGPPVDDEQDYELPVWAGEVPLRLRPGAPVADPRLPVGVPVPTHVSGWHR
jgi:nitroimidazol reductase NimA-like FMN-containing flavoprotein (pyridoxamine 5'-phosphate oxidase superfamily)